MSVIPLYPEAGDGAQGGAELLAAIDIGSTQIVCMIGELRRERKDRKGARARLAITGVGTRAAKGIRAGVVVDVAAAERAIRLAVEAAERMAGAQVSDVWVNLSGGRLKVRTLQASMPLNGAKVSATHLAALRARALAGFDERTRMVVQVVPAGFSLDGGPWLENPQGLHGDVLAARVNVATMIRGPLANLEQALTRSHLRVAGLLPAPVAAAEAVLTEDERALGVVVADIGASQIAWAAFADGMLREGGTLPVGGHHITHDIAAGLHTPISEAEKLKTVHGSVVPMHVDDGEPLSIPVLGEKGPGGWQQVPRGALNEIIRPRAEEMMEMLRDALAHLPAGMRQRVVLTGGGSELVGLADMAEQTLSARVRIGQAGAIHGLPRILAGPAHAVAAGLLLAAARADAQGFGLARQAERLLAANGGGYLSRVKRWFEESF